ncbi:MAG: hypothetical protein H0X31_02890 [Nostocaceae cyanobacterium]|nr:hypothetical protein [Nostocaceae cyanobacterium]
MLTKEITRLLSNHRNSKKPMFPQALTKHKILTLISSSLCPNQSQENLVDEIQNALNELQAEGEILFGKQNLYCVAYPMVLATNKEDLTGLLFRGDRAYLTMTHQVLESQQRPQNPLLLRPKKPQFHRVKDSLSQVGIRLLTISDSIENLPKPRQPLKSELRSAWSLDPFSIKIWQNGGYIQRYIACNESQKNRWRNPSRQSIKNEDILRLPTGEYLWFEDQHFYELEPDLAILAMFYQDTQMRCPLKIIWDEPLGKLNLQGVCLPYIYAQWLWHISEPGEEYRTRNFQSKNWSLVKEAFERLGSKLV